MKDTAVAPPKQAKQNRTRLSRPNRDPVKSSKSEFHHGGILADQVFEIALSAVRPAAVNDTVYRPVNLKDPAIIAMAREMLDPTIGQLEPVVLTDDGVLLSGHRRHAARTAAGLPTIKARRFPILSTDPRFPELLVRFNGQREKDPAELFREELVRLNPVDAHQRLVTHRESSSQVKVETMTITGTKTRAGISEAKLPLLNAIIDAINAERKFWPLSDRRVHYLLLNTQPLRHANKPDSKYVNDDKSYDSLTELLTRARLTGQIPFTAIADPTRPVVLWDVFPGVQGFIRRELEWFLKQYRRDLQQTQPLHVEIVGEKNTIASVIRPVAEAYSIPFTIGRGYASLSPRYDIVKRFQGSGKAKLLLLFLSDFDPEGDDIAHSFVRSIRDDFDVANVEAVKVALTRAQVQRLELPPLIKAKAGSSRRKAFVERHGGEYVWELDALSPVQLQNILREAIRSVLDMDAYRAELKAEQNDAAQLEAIRGTMRSFLVSNFAEFATGHDSGEDDQ